ncbi:MAG: glycosyltransferase family 9 protein [Candidatus Omnitrophota bacterium]
MKIKNILIFNPFGIGDVLCSTPLVRNLKQSLPESSITYICNRRAYPLLKNNTFIDKILIFEKDEWKHTARQSKIKFLQKAFSFWQEIKKEKFDVVFDLSMNSQYGFFLKTTGIKLRIGFDFKKRGRFLTHKIDLSQGFRDKHVAKYYLDLLKFLNITPKDYNYDLFISENSKKQAKAFLRNHNLDEDCLLLGVCPGSGDSWGKTAYYRRWPKDNFVALCDMLNSIPKVKIILFGSKTEADICEYVYEKTKIKPLNLCAKIGLEQFCSLFSLCTFIITNDGGPFHIGRALKKKGAAFFGPVDEKVYGVYPNEGACLVFKKEISCRPCYNKFKFNGCNFDKKCLRQINPEDVFTAIKDKFLL